MTTDTATTYPARVALVCPRCEHGIPLTELASWVNAYASGEQWDETCAHCGTTVALHLECVGTTPALPASAYPQDHPLGWPEPTSMTTDISQHVDTRWKQYRIK